MGKRNKKATNKILTMDYLKGRAEGLVAAGFSKSKWIYFCEEMMRLGFTVELYEARQTKSKYCTVRHNGKSFKVRFSDHKPIYHREMNGDCDFFVGWTHTGIRNTHDAANAVCNFFGVQRIKGMENPKVTTGILADFI
jgi:hypothetical protein